MVLLLVVGAGLGAACGSCWLLVVVGTGLVSKLPKQLPAGHQAIMLQYNYCCNGCYLLGIERMCVWSVCFGECGCALVG